MPRPPCKYGTPTADNPRGVGPDGYCPKGRPSSRSKSGAGAARTAGPSKSGNPCKYGAKYVTADNPRGQIKDRDTGKWRCPIQSEAGVAAVTREIIVKSADTAIKKTAKNAAEDIVAAYRKDPERVTGAARETLTFMGKLFLPVALMVTAIQLGIVWGKQAKKQQDATVELLAINTLIQTRRMYTDRGHVWDSKWDAPLLTQYRQYYRSQAVRINQSGGK